MAITGRITYIAAAFGLLLAASVPALAQTATAPDSASTGSDMSTAPKTTHKKTHHHTSTVHHAKKTPVVPSSNG